MIRRQRTTLYVTSDNKRFTSQGAAIEHEKLILLTSEAEKYFRACSELGVKPSAEEISRFILACPDLIIALRGTSDRSPQAPTQPSTQPVQGDLL